MSEKDITKKLSTESYKGVRDFYPTDLFVQHFIFNVWKKAVQSFGYEEYDASVLENSDIYKAKSGQELVNEQTYTFIDRGDREVTLRPEMTPSLARMVAARKRELGFPLRLFSIPNCFRYERPQRGRLREFWQLNVDLLTKKQNARYDVEILTLVSTIMKGFNAKDSDYEIRVNSRAFISALYTHYYELNAEQALAFQKLTDKKSKISVEEFQSEYTKLSDKKILDVNDSSDLTLMKNMPEVKESLDALLHTIDLAKQSGITNIIFDTDVVRGLDYYTGLVFEVKDTDPQNNRALFGGGRYDNLVDIFDGAVDENNISGIGFGIGDVPMQNFLESRGLIPEYKAEAGILVCVMDEEEVTLDYADEVAAQLRTEGNNVAINYTSRKYPDNVKLAEKLGIRKMVMVGEKEVAEKKFEVKPL